ncbi:hypothetical protein BLA29_013711 [Euroglyphus maynei]|uniref:Uncharacterized protein n=1 Tax=Euroglyphus maynei TaxID=6958 RepID=A0A1Y3BCC6_EURMA|nr:hypothetical protein BLA29_013711 [Euroglyphus maynei]
MLHTHMTLTYQYLVHKVLLHVHIDPSVWPVDRDHEQTLDSFPNKALPMNVVVVVGIMCKTTINKI